MRLINLTPHTITFQPSSTFKNHLLEIEPSGTVARVEMEEKTLCETGLKTEVSGKSAWYGIEVYVVAQTPKAVNIPEPQQGVGYIVSGVVLEALKGSGRTDVFAPNTNKAQRNEQGHIVSVPGLVGLLPKDE